MPPAINDDWSDSDDENSSEIETSVLLGVPDAPIELASDLSDVAVSRIGGHPVRTLMQAMPGFDPFSSRHIFHRVNPPSRLHAANRALLPWNYLCRSGVHLKIAPWIELCTCGDVPRAHAKGRRGGKSSIIQWKC